MKHFRHPGQVWRKGSETDLAACFGAQYSAGCRNPYFSNDDMAIGGVHHCLAEGLSVPEQLAIVGFNGPDIGQATAKPLSTAPTLRYDIGLLADQAILARLDDKNGATAPTDVGFELIVGREHRFLPLITRRRSPCAGRRMLPVPGAAT